MQLQTYISAVPFIVRTEVKYKILYKWNLIQCMTHFSLISPLYRALLYCIACIRPLSLISEAMKILESYK